MLWVTRSKIRVNRAATGWLVRRFIDPDASFRLVDPADLARFQADHGAIGFPAEMDLPRTEQSGAGIGSFDTISLVASVHSLTDRCHRQRLSL